MQVPANATVSTVKIPLVHRPKNLPEFHAANERRATRFQQLANGKLGDLLSMSLVDIQDME